MNIKLLNYTHKRELSVLHNHAKETPETHVIFCPRMVMLKCSVRFLTRPIATRCSMQMNHDPAHEVSALALQEASRRGQDVWSGYLPFGPLGRAVCASREGAVTAVLLV